MKHRRLAGAMALLLTVVTACSGAGRTASGHLPHVSSEAASPTRTVAAPAEGSTVARQLRDAADEVTWPVRPIPSDAAQHPVQLDRAHQSTRTIDTPGGEVSTPGPGGTQLRLIVPPDALFFPTKITITPISGIGGLEPGPPGLIGIDIQPHGLQLAELARLEITGTDPGPVIGFSYSGTGAGLEPAVIGPETQRPVVYVDHFSGVGVGPFAALGEALSAAGDHTRADLSNATASAHNARSGADLDTAAQAFSNLVDALGSLAATTPEACGTQAFSDRLAVLAWINAKTQFAATYEVDITNLNVIHALTEHLLTCWKNESYSCVRPSPTQLRALQGIRAALSRYDALDAARQRSGKDSLSELLPCSAGGFVHYRYNDTDGGVSTQISVMLDLRLRKDPDGGGLAASSESSYTMTYASTKGGECPSGEYGQTRLTLSDTDTGFDVQPELHVALDQDTPSIWFAPIYYGHWADCHDAGSGWQAVALACDPRDPTGSLDWLIPAALWD